MEHFEKTAAATPSSRDGLYFVDADVYDAKEANEIQLLVQRRPLVISKRVTNKPFSEISLGHLLPLAIPIEVSGR